eukprot:Nk52_evm41s2118 gene=Nk52_evmTU41s2118
MKIREERETDWEKIEKLTYKAFEHDPYHAPGEPPSEHLIVNRLRESNMLTVSLVSVKEMDAAAGNQGEEQVVGHVAFSPVMIKNSENQTQGIPQGWYGLGPVSVDESQRKQGIAAKLIQTGLDILKEKFQARGVVVLGNPAYYGRFGFKCRPNLILPGVPPEVFMALLLDEKDSQGFPSGQVAYHSAFN